MTVKMGYRNYFFFFTGVFWYRLRRGQHGCSNGSRHIQIFRVFTSHRFDVRNGSIKIYTLYETCILLWRFDPIPGHGLPLRGLAITIFGHTTLGGTPVGD